MRKDMKDLLVNTGRHGGHGKAAESRRARFKNADPDSLPSRISTSRHKQFGWDGKELGDRLGPLYQFLETNCGRKWDNVYSEIVKVSDHRSIRGYHLLQHVWSYVNPTNYTVGYRGGWPFFVDTDGTLQKQKQKKYKYIPEKKNPVIKESADHYWEKIEGFWYEFTVTHAKSTYPLEWLVDRGNNKVDIVRVLKETTTSNTTKRQVNSKTQKELDRRFSEK